MIKFDESELHVLSRQIFTYNDAIEMSLRFLSLLRSLRLLFVIFLEINQSFEERFIKTKLLFVDPDFWWSYVRSLYCLNIPACTPHTLSTPCFISQSAGGDKKFFEVYSMIVGSFIRFKIAESTLIFIEFSFFIEIISG